MTGKEIFKKAVKLEKTERVPVIILSGGVWAYNLAGKSLQQSFDMPPEESASYWAAVNEKIRSDLIWCAAGCNHLVLRAVGAKTNFANVGDAAGTEPFLERPSDVDKIDVSKIKDDAGIQAMLESTRLLKNKIGDSTMLAVSQWGPMTLAQLMVGATPFMLMLRKDPEGAKYIMECTTEMVIEYWKLFAQAGAEHVSQAEPVASGDMISPKMFESFALPYLQKTNKAIDPYVFSKMIHICGNTTKILNVLPETGADLFSMDYKVSLATSREILDGRMAFAGQIDPSEIMLMSGTERVTQVAQQCIDDADWKRGGFMLMPGCDLAPATPIENVQAMVNTAYANTQIL
ncbi:MAG: uroporphyrinogen decarboxylase family protein [Oscillospiraceae bacterium]